MNTPKPSVLELAKQGDLRAIAALMNRPLQAKGISADVSVQGEALAVKLESEQSPPQDALVQFVHRGLSNLNIPNFNRVKLSGYRSGQSAPDWEQDVELHALPDFLETPTPITLPSPPPRPPAPPPFPHPPAAPEPPVVLATDLPLPPMDDPVDEPMAAIPPDAHPDIPLPPDPLQPLETLEPLPPDERLEMEEPLLPPLAPVQLEDYTLVDEVEIADGARPDLDSPLDGPLNGASDRTHKTDAPVGLAGILFGAAIALLAAIIAWFAYTRLLQPQPQPIADPDVAPTTAVSPGPELLSPLPAEGDASPTPVPGDLPTPPPDQAPASPSPTAPVEQAPAATVPASSTDPFGDAVARATEAANLSQTATTVEQWQQIAQLWQEAATFMGLVPADNPNFATAQDRVTVYLGNRDVALQKVQELGG